MGKGNKKFLVTLYLLGLKTLVSHPNVYIEIIMGVKIKGVYFYIRVFMFYTFIALEDQIIF